VVEVAAHALNLGQDWRRVFNDVDEVETIVESLVLQRAVDLRHEERRAFAQMVANAMSGARSIDGRRPSLRSSSTS
jgi:hypothetical protein